MRASDTSDADLISRHIESEPEYLGSEDARLAGSGVHVWAIAGYAPVVDWDVTQIAADYKLTQEEVEAALAYERRHQYAIEARIVANNIPIT
jgi:uncharacterized protein (DUF433 family)